MVAPVEEKRDELYVVLGQELGGGVHTVLEEAGEPLPDWLIVRAVKKKVLGIVAGCLAVGATKGVGGQEVCRLESVGDA